MTTLRLATFNVHHCRGLDGVVDIERTAATIDEIGADLIALQELDRNVRRSGKIDQPAELGRLTNMWVSFFPTAAVGGGDFGIAVAARRRCDVMFRLLPKTPFDRRHAAGIARVDRLTVLATHVSRKPQARAIEMPKLWSICRALETPKVVAGDLNTARFFLGPMSFAAVTTAPACIQPTFPATAPSRQPDHILVSRDVDVFGCRTVVSGASDHLPLVVDIDF